MIVGILVALLSLWLAAGGWRADEWQTLLDTGDRLAASGGSLLTEAGPLSARAAYLLAFHHAQDGRDVRRMLVAAERLERLGEHELALHLRAITREVSLGVGR